MQRLCNTRDARERFVCGSKLLHSLSTCEYRERSIAKRKGARLAVEDHSGDRGRAPAAPWPNAFMRGAGRICRLLLPARAYWAAVNERSGDGPRYQLRASRERCAFRQR